MEELRLRKIQYHLQQAAEEVKEGKGEEDTEVLEGHIYTALELIKFERRKLGEAR